MKKRFAYCAMLCMLVSLVMNSTLAYFTTEETARNVITSGGIDIQVVEQQLANGSLHPYPTDPIKVMPGSQVSKIVSVQNLDEQAWVRMTYTVTVVDADGKKMNVTTDGINRIMDLNEDTANWTYADGWWYYNQALATGEETKPLFTQVVFSGPEMGNAYQNCTVLIDVTAQAIQKVHNGETVMDAAGWPVG